MNKELESCPFCGGDPKLTFMNGELFIECQKCPAVMKWFATSDEAVSAWNQRENTQAFKDGVELVIGIIEKHQVLAAKAAGADCAAYRLF